MFSQYLIYNASEEVVTSQWRIREMMNNVTYMMGRRGVYAGRFILFAFMKSYYDDASYLALWDCDMGKLWPQCCT
jgi:hypothetical protein